MIHQSRSHVENLIQNKTAEVQEAEQEENNSTETNSSNSNTTSKEEEFNNKADIPAGGLVSNLPPSAAQSSSYGELSDFVAASNNAMGKGGAKITELKSKVTSYLSMPSKEKLLSMLKNKFPNLNINAVSKGLGIFQSAFCGDSNSLIYGLRDLIDSLNYGFDFISTWNICGRQRLRNPLEVYFKTKRDLEYSINQGKNIHNRLYLNLNAAAKSFITRNGLPQDLQNCMQHKTLEEAAKALRDRITLQEWKDLINLFNQEICAKSQAGIGGNSNTINKLAATPFISGLCKYDTKTMYASALSIFNNPNSGVDKISIVEILITSLLDPKNKKDAIKNLDLIKLIVTIDTDTSVVKPSSISPNNLNSYLQGSNKDKVDTIRRNIHDGVTDVLDMLDTPYEKNNIERDLDILLTLDVCLILKNLEEDVKDCKDPEFEFRRITNMLYTTNRFFKEEESIDMLASSKTMSDLATRYVEGRSPSSFFKIEEIDDVQYHVVQDDNMTITDVAIFSEVKLQNCGCNCGGMCGCDGLLFAS